MSNAEAIAEDLKAPGKFNARNAITGNTYPVDSVDLYSDAEAAHKINVLANDAAKARYGAQAIHDRAYAAALEQFTADQNAESEDPAIEAKAAADASLPYKLADAQAVRLETKLAEALPALRETMLTFHLRGLAPAQWRTIHKLGRREVKEPVRKHFEKGEDGDEAFQAELVERSIERNNWINNSCIASAITKVENRNGDVDTSVWSVEDVANLFDTYLESEYGKLKATMESLTFANNLFQVAVQEDIDFLQRR